MSSVYVGSSLHNAEEAKRIMDLFIENGVKVTYDWTAHGQVTSEEELQLYGFAEVKGVREADLFFMIHPARNGSHVELGIAIALNKPVIIFLTDQVEMKPFYYVRNVHRFNSMSHAFSRAMEILKQ